MDLRLLNARAVAALAICLSLIAAVSAQEAPASPQPGKAVVVVLVRGGSPSPFHMAYDEQWISRLPTASYFAFPAWPGRHRLAPAIKMERLGIIDGADPSMQEFDVKAGEIYYIEGVTGSGKHRGRIGLQMISQQEALAKLAGITAVQWQKDLLTGTLAEVHPLGARVGQGEVCGRAEWNPDLNSAKDLGESIHRGAALKGTIRVQDDALVMELAAGVEEPEPMGLVIPYADISTAVADHRLAHWVVAITRKNGHVDSFSVTTAGGGRVDGGQTKACAAQIAGKLQG
jgi:hypothetical protein